jgi:hypothetical protein
VERIQLDRELDYRSKLDRRPELLEQLREYGKAKWHWFAEERESRGRSARRVTGGHLGDRPAL